MGIVDTLIMRPLKGIMKFRPSHLKALLKARWWDDRYTDLRYGHSFYFVYPIGIFNFILISYRMFVKPIADMFVDTFPPLWRFQTLGLYMMLFPITYIPIAVYVGHLHKEKMANQQEERRLLAADKRRREQLEKQKRDQAAKAKPVTKVIEEKPTKPIKPVSDFVCPYIQQLKAKLGENGLTDEIDEIEKAEKFLLEETVTEEIV